jgi:hypothetical protein
MPTPTYTALATVTLGTSASSDTFSSIPATYRDLIVVATNPSLTGVPLSGTGLLKLNDTGGTSVRMIGTSGGAASSTRTNVDVPFDNNNGVFIINIMDYSATDKHKTVLVRANREDNLVGAYAGRVAITEAVTSLELVPPQFDFSIGSTFNLYGVIA